MPSIAFRRETVTAARSRSAARKLVSCERSPFSAATIAYSVGPFEQRRPSASFLMPASTWSRRSVRPTAIHPVRQPGARYAFDSDENEMIGASGCRLAIGGTGPSYARSP
jgi:hypothetical protein